MEAIHSDSGFITGTWRRRLRVAQGTEPADVVIAGGTVVNVFSHELIRADVANVDGHIAGVGIDVEAAVRIDAAGLFVAPSFIDAHNIVAVGVEEVDILAVIAAVAESQGGLAAVADVRVLGHLPLPIAGLLSDRPLADVAEEYAAVESAARDLGSLLPSPFGMLAFMALSVIPEARVTDRGFLAV